jgi:hypothetical protein
MGRKFFLFGVGAFVLGAPLGCTKQVVRDKAPPDPLLVSKKAVEGKQHVAPPEPRARAEFPPPPAPTLPGARGGGSGRLAGLEPVQGERR